VDVVHQIAARPLGLLLPLAPFLLQPGLELGACGLQLRTSQHDIVGDIHVAGVIQYLFLLLELERFDLLVERLCVDGARAVACVVHGRGGVLGADSLLLGVQLALGGIEVALQSLDLGDRHHRALAFVLELPLQNLD
jgi:hypothetical protein